MQGTDACAWHFDVMCPQGYGNQRFVFQGVHETICYGPSDKPWGDNEPRINQIVFIGRKLDRKALMEGFRSVPSWASGCCCLCSKETVYGSV